MASRALGLRLGLLLLSGTPALATDVRVVAITPGRSADVIINGSSVTLEVGEQTGDGVKLLSADRDHALMRIDGKSKSVYLEADRPGGGAAAGSSSSSSSSSGGTIVLSTDAYGQFMTRGLINGHSVPCLIDTGATVTTLSTASADDIGLAYEQGIPTKAMTVNGEVDGWRVKLDSVQLGDVTAHNIDAMVVDNDALPMVLLGQSFLYRFDMLREGRKLVLRRRR